MRSALLRCLALLLLITAACGGASDEAEPATLPTDRLPKALAPGTDSIVAELALRLGELDGAPEYAFGEVTAIAPRKDDSFYVCDRNDVSIREYDARGAFVRRIGRKGAGPGEYESCHFLSLVGDSVLWVGDVYNGRFVAFRSQGDAAGSEAGVVLGGDYSNGQLVDRAGRFWWARATIDRRQGMDHQEFVVTDRTLKRLDVISLPPRLFGPLYPKGFAISTIEGVYSSVSNDTAWSVAPDGSILTASPLEYRVSRSHGSLPPLSIEREVPSVRYETDERVEWERWRAFNDARNGRIGDHASVPETKPAISAVRGDDLGRVWVKVRVRAEKRDIPPRPAGNRMPLLTWRERNTYDLFTASGAYIGRVAFPHATQLLATRGDRVWLREEGPSGEHVIGIYDLKPATR